MGKHPRVEAKKWSVCKKNGACDGTRFIQLCESLHEWMPDNGCFFYWHVHAWVLCNSNRVYNQALYSIPDDVTPPDFDKVVIGECSNKCGRQNRYNKNGKCSECEARWQQGWRPKRKKNASTLDTNASK